MDNNNTEQDEGIELSEAAEIMGMTTEALRKRIQRGKEKGYKVDGRWYVVLPRQHRVVHGDRTEETSQDNDSEDDRTMDRTSPDDVNGAVQAAYQEHIDSLRKEIEFLEDQLRRKDDMLGQMIQQNTMKDHTIGIMGNKLAQLPTGQSEVAATSDTTQSASDTTAKEQQHAKRGWWPFGRNERLYPHPKMHIYPSTWYRAKYTLVLNNLSSVDDTIFSSTLFPSPTHRSSVKH